MSPQNETTSYIRFDNDDKFTLCAMFIDRLYVVRDDGLVETNVTDVSKPLGHCLCGLQAGMNEVFAVEPLPLGISYSIRQVENRVTHQVGGAIDLHRDSKLMPVEEFKSFAHEKQAQVVGMLKWTIINRGANRNQACLPIDEDQFIDGADNFAAAFNSHLNEEIEVSVHDSMRNEIVLRSMLSKLMLQHPPPEHKKNLVLRGFVTAISYSKPGFVFAREHNAGTVKIECPKPELVMPHLSLLASRSCLFEACVSVAEYKRGRKSVADLKCKLLEIKAVKEFDAEEIIDNLEAVANSLAQLSASSEEWNKKSRKDKFSESISPQKGGNGKRKK